jgi:hypothetical protein
VPGPTKNAVIGAADRSLQGGEWVPEWQELAKDRRKWRKMLKSIKIRR